MSWIAGVAGEGGEEGAARDGCYVKVGGEKVAESDHGSRCGNFRDGTWWIIRRMGVF